MNSRLRYLLFLPPAVALVVALVSGWPGAVSPDMRTTIQEGRDFAFWGHQEPMFGFLWAGIQLIASPEIAVPACFVLQSVAYWAAWLLLAREGLRAGSVVAAVLAVAGGFVPPLLCFTVMVESNIESAIAWIVAVALAASCRSRASLVLCGVCLWIGFAIRSGMVVAVVPVAFACLVLRIPEIKKWKALATALAIAVVFQGFSFAITKTVLGAPTRDSVLSVSQAFDMAGIYRETGVHHVPAFMVPEGHTAEAIFAEYDPANCSGLFWRDDGKPTLRLPQNADEGAQVRSAWLRTLGEFPGAWLDVKLRYAGLFLMVGVEWPAGIWPEYGANADIGLSRPEAPDATLLCRYGGRTVTTVLWKGWFWLIAAGAFVLAGLLTRAPRATACAAIYVAGICALVPHFLFGQATLCRYYFLPYSLCIASILLVLPGLLAMLRGKRALNGDAGSAVV